MAELSSCCVLVTPRSYGQNDPRLKTELESRVGKVIYGPSDHPLSSQELHDMLAVCDGYIAGVDNIDRNALRQANRLKVIARYGVGVDQVDIQAAAEMGIVVTNTPGANAVSVAELTLGLMLSLARHIPSASMAAHRGEWPQVRGIALEGKTVGLLGMGMIGKQVARRLQGFDCTVLAHDAAPDTEFAVGHQIELLSLAEIVERADFLSLHLPLLPATRGLINAAFLQSMKRGAYLINTSRGELVDEAALFEALQSGHLAGAALDVFSREPPDTDNPLLALPQVVATPHIGAHTDSATNAMGWAALNDCLAVLEGRQPLHRVA
jgi:D-3-phosphoglycerate dehydrogenase / 2-oxoglutarate reductase